MDSKLSDVEELTLCNFCKQKFNSTDLCPKILQCKHYFCLKCIETTMLKGRELFCVNCWKRTEVSDAGAADLQTHNPILSLTSRLSLLNGEKKSDNKEVKPQQQQQSSQQVTDMCHAHVLPCNMWCHTCHKSLCRMCIMRAEHPGHQLKTENEAKHLLVNEVQAELSSINKIMMDIQRLAIYQREFLLKVLEACITLKTCLESDLQITATPEVTETKDLMIRAKAGLLQFNTPMEAQNIHASLIAEKQRLEAKYNDMLLQCKLDDLIGSSGVVLDFQILTQAVTTLQNTDFIFPRQNSGTQNPILFLTNYCMSQLYSRYVVSKSQNQLDFFQSKMNQNNEYIVNKFDFLNDNIKTDIVIQNGCYFGKNDYIPSKINVYESNMSKSKYDQSPPISMMRNPNISYPMYFFNIDLNSNYFGRIVIETRPDVAPKMSKNFAALCTGEMGVSYKNCTIFQCWDGESIITGDYETNNGRGGRSIYEEGYFMPDETKIPSVRGAVGMRRTQKKHDNFGLVGSQFRVILQEMPGFTAIFGHVVEGIGLIEKIASFGDQTGKPTRTITITSCGKL